jgi:hypothetical protein
MKSVEDRILECKNIRTQFQSMGLLVLPSFKDALSKHMNAFITLDESQTFKLSAINQTYEVVLTVNEKKKSGVRVIM